MRGLTILAVTGDPDRLHAALSLAAAQAALGGQVHLHLHGNAAALLSHGRETELVNLWTECVALGVTGSVCQGGLAAVGVTINDLPAEMEPGGLVGLLAKLGDDRLVCF